MSRGKGAKKEIDPEVIIARKFRAKCRFRAIGRMVMANVYWLMEGVEEYEGVDDVKRRVEQAVRAKSKKKQLLTIHDKALLNKPADVRTEHEKKYIYRIIGGLKCFKRYPNQVKKKLAAVTYFKYYGPGRVLVRQHHEAQALYFIISGKVTVSHLVYDELLEKHVPVEIRTMHSGDMFGEISLLHSIPRTATVTTTEHSEFLELMKEDFKSILQATVQKQWDEVSRAMSAFTYFDALDEVALREGCTVARLKAFNINETLVGDGRGVPNFVYFVLSGQCQMIETLQVIVTETLNRKHFQLYDPYVKPEESEPDLEKKYFEAYKDKFQSSFSEESALTKDFTAKVKPGSNVQIIDREPGVLHVPLEYGTRLSGENVGILKDSTEAMQDNNIPSTKRLRSNVRISADEGHGKTILPPSEHHRESVRFSVLHQPIKPSNIRTYFMQVCLLNPGSTFGFGENMRDRRIVAKTPVYCMLMPKIWLLQRNTANIWTRIQHYLEKKIPNKKQLFKEFLRQRRWEEFRTQVVDDVVMHSKAVNLTSVHDVPYSIRIEEMFDI